MTLEELRELYPKLSPAGKRRVLADLERGIENFHTELMEGQLTPQIKYKIADPAQPEPPDTETAVRQFFRDHPETREIKVGNITYQR